jgi:hypothetical protein
LEIGWICRRWCNTSGYNVGRDEAILRTQRRPFRGKRWEIHPPFFTFGAETMTGRKPEDVVGKMEEKTFVKRSMKREDNFGAMREETG